MKRRITAFLLTFALLTLTGCGAGQEETENTEEEALAPAISELMTVPQIVYKPETTSENAPSQTLAQI